MIIKVVILITLIVNIAHANPIVGRVLTKVVKPKKAIRKYRVYKKINYIKLKIFNGRQSYLKVSQRRRVTTLEKNLLTSYRAKKVRFNGRTVIKRNIFRCTRENINKMLAGKAPLDKHNRSVNLHHLKQQKMGSLVELSHYEHTKHSKVLHRYTTTSEITDRNSAFKNFRTQWWMKKRKKLS